MFPSIDNYFESYITESYFKGNELEMSFSDRVGGMVGLFDKLEEFSSIFEEECKEFKLFSERVFLMPWTDKRLGLKYKIYDSKQNNGGSFSIIIKKDGTFKMEMKDAKNNEVKKREKYHKLLEEAFENTKSITQLKGLFVGLKNKG